MGYSYEKALKHTYLYRHHTIILHKMIKKANEKGEKGGEEKCEPPKKIEYKQLPPEVEEVVSEERATIEAVASITFDGRQYLVRFPKDISESIGLSGDHKVRFRVIIPKPRTDETPKLTIEVFKDAV